MVLMILCVLSVVAAVIVLNLHNRSSDASGKSNAVGDNKHT
jgi:hypothetical protein